MFRILAVLGGDRKLLPIGARPPREELPNIDGPAMDTRVRKGTNMEDTTLEALLADWRSMVETSLQEHLASPEPILDPYMGMMHYHMGWVDREFRPDRPFRWQAFTAPASSVGVQDPGT